MSKTFDITINNQDVSVRTQDNVVELFVSDDRLIAIVYDNDPPNPRVEYDNIGTMVCWHRRYRLGDEQPSCTPEEYLESLLDDEIQALERNFVILPLYLYDHGGLTISTGPFSCPWDSGQVGFIYCSMERARSEWGSLHDPEELSLQAEQYLKGEVEIYAKYLSGDVYGVLVADFDFDEAEVDFDEVEVDFDDLEIADSCWGFYGLGSAIECGKEMASALPSVKAVIPAQLELDFS